MTPKRFNVTTKKTYTKDEQEKVVWLNVGTITQFDDGMSLELNMFPVTKFFVFEQKPKEQGQQGQSNQERAMESEGVPSDLPF